MKTFKKTIERSYCFARSKYFRIRGECSSLASVVEHLPVKTLEARKKHVFFGYYDITPFNADDGLILALRTQSAKRAALGNVDIIVYDAKDLDAKPRELGVSETWCWQQGCRLRWLPSNNVISYNSMVGGKYGNISQDVTTGEIVNEIESPLYDISPDGCCGLGLDFSRLHRLRRGYGYSLLPDETAGVSAPDDNGIWRVDMETGKSELLVSVADIAGYQPMVSMADAEHYFNHISINPEGTRFMFFHLWVNAWGRHNRVVTCDMDGQNMRVLNDEGITSHYAWLSPDTLVACVIGGDKSVIYRAFKDNSRESYVVGDGVLDFDGHPSYSKDRSKILVDSYPDVARYQRLYVFDNEKAVLKEIACFDSPCSFWRDERCDLHPRWSSSGIYISIDMPRKSGYRAMGVVDLSGGV